MKCSNCKKVFYCSSKCQLDHWKTGHRGQCSIIADTKKTQFIQSTAPPASTPTSSEPLLFLFPPERVNKLLTFQEKFEIGCGLKNIGNTCYVNAVLQCLTHTKSLATFFLSERHTSKCTKKPKEFCILCFFETHLRIALGIEDKYEWVVPKEIILNLNQLGEFRYGFQEDAHEFSVSLLMALHNAFYQIHQDKVLNLTLTPEERCRIEETTFIYQLFGGYLQNEVKCTICSNVSRKQEPFLELHLELCSGSFSLEESLENYTKIEQLNGYQCEKCQALVDAQKQLSIYQPPNILMLQLKRFDLSLNGMKINKSVVFSEHLDLKRIMSPLSEYTEMDLQYELYGVIVHYGSSLFVGHYTSFVNVDGVWVLFDDERVTPLPNISVVMKQNPYMLFYRKKVPIVKQPKKKSIVEVPNEQKPKAAAAKGKRGKGRNTPASQRETPESSSLSSNGQERAMEENSDIIDLHKNEKDKKVFHSFTPKHQVYFTMKDEGIDALLMKVYLEQSTDPTSLIGLVNSTGNIFLESTEQGGPTLSVRLLFKFQVENCSATYYKDNILIVTLPLIHEEEVEEKSSKIPVVVSESNSDIVPLDPDQEIDIAQEQPQFSKVDNFDEEAPTKPKSKIEQEMEEIEKINKPKPESEYKNLYAEIEKAKQSQQVPAQKLTLNPKQNPTNTTAGSKVGRNTECPCGSGRKYKVCHGKLTKNN
uniref:Ubiquitin carboxyl-terminal hydrolase n=1 Tax=Arcella intermedia TaxID=1963864 RepID=A0A6B2KZ39_9EUKA